ncbi:hypothetical protein BST92_01450 [Nonlabens arenilitoris]|uniref:Uncharacterized protein n=1 Tax=Nonlabens arenilitoris TaxID=1217969 RepID=A0A2S7U6N6_9FLAO|nr:hypothetical protein [Nonlabens arenilitoris]PQJ30678.1 hypothetical protein BST92_01450 [Nonlabens arenilitoris]
MISLTITSCSVNSLEEDDLNIQNNELTLKSNTVKSQLYVSWETTATKDQKIHLREELTYSHPFIKLHSFSIDENIHSGEIWEVSFQQTEAESTDPVLWIEDETVIDIASFEPF